MRLRICAMLLLAIAGGAPADDYVGAALHLGSHDQFLDCHGDVCGSMPRHDMWGAQLEYGWYRDFASAYVGLRQRYANHSRSISETDWTSTRLLAGFRLNVKRSQPNPVLPLFGFGFTFGWEGFRERPLIAMPVEPEYHVYSKGTVGTLIELGFMFNTRRAWIPILTGHLHVTSPDFHGSYPRTNSNDGAIIEYGVGLGILLDS